MRWGMRSHGVRHAKQIDSAPLPFPSHTHSSPIPLGPSARSHSRCHARSTAPLTTAPHPTPTQPHLTPLIPNIAFNHRCSPSPPNRRPWLLLRSLGSSLVDHVPPMRHPSHLGPSPHTPTHTMLASRHRAHPYAWSYAARISSAMPRGIRLPTSHLVYLRERDKLVYLEYTS